MSPHDPGAGMTTQPEFRDALLDPDRPVPEGLRDGQGRPAGRRFAVYRNNVAVSLTEALATGFPVIEKLIGAENFRKVAGLFLRAHPPSSPLMMHYGDAFPGFLEGFQPLAHLGYLPDTARLELALRRSYHAADATPITGEDLAAIPPEALTGARLDLVPAALLLRSRWPIHAIWRFNTDDAAPKPEMRGENVLVTRPDYDPEPRLLPPGGGLFLAQTQTGEPIGAALDAATQAVPDFDLGALLALLLNSRAIARISLEDQP